MDYNRTRADRDPPMMTGARAWRARRPSEEDEPKSFRQAVDGVELHWSERGKGSSTIVVLHGLSDSERTW